MSAITSEKALPFAKRALGAASPDAIRHLILICENGGMHGKVYDDCFYGLLAKGSGTDLSGEDYYERLVAFCSERLGVKIVFNRLDPLEQYLHDIHKRHTYKTSPELAQILMWCEEELGSRKTFVPPWVNWIKVEQELEKQYPGALIGT
ncbi:MAG: hypothetical protein JWN50_118 [Parcubacteria group bacterium]|nr:hypothetical protein [Parcubacteria group bacterium]